MILQLSYFFTTFGLIATEYYSLLPIVQCCLKLFLLLVINY